jgi:ADP-L-glycero-D-manno-heptose 6-epimerase
MPKSLVTGGAGFIGSNLSLTLENLGHEVTVIDDFSSADEKNLIGFKGLKITGDICHQNLDLPFDYIFHQAAITDPRFGDDKLCYEKNVGGFRTVLDLAVKYRARLIYASTAGVYGNGPVPMQEDQAKDCLTAYGRSKLKMDEIAETYFDKLSIVGLRYFNVFGPREAHKGRPASMVLHLLRQMRKGQRPKLFNFGEQKRDFIYVQDVVSANLCAMTSPSGIFNVGTGVAATFNDLVTALNQVLRLPLEPEYFEMPYDAATYQSNTQAETLKAETILKFKFAYDLETAIADYYQWLKVHEPQSGS